MRFANPIWLWLLPVASVLLVLFYWWSERKRRRLLAQFVESRLLAGLTAGISITRRRWRFGLVIATVVCILVALAQPEHGYDLEEVDQFGLDLVVAVDTSKSMLATDIAPNRLERAKLAALELMQRSGADRLALVAFAGEGFLECPLTTDNSVFQQSVQGLDVNTIPEGGTSLASAIQTSLTAFRETGRHRAMVLFTDGEDNVDASQAVAAAQQAAKAGMKIFTVGVGTAAGDLIRITDSSGNSDFLRDDHGNVLKSHLNEPLLQEIARISGGFYLPLRGANTMDLLYDHGLSTLPASESKSKLIRRYHEQYQWPLGLAVLLWIVEWLWPERPRVKLHPGVRAVIPLLLGSLLLSGFETRAANPSPSSAMILFRQGNFTNSLDIYQSLADVHTNDLRYAFNAGAAAYKATNFDLAMTDFQIAAAAPDLRLQQMALYNLGNTEYRMGESQFQPTGNSLNQVEDSWNKALKFYKQAWQLSTNDPDTSYNLQFVQNQLALIKELQEAMRRAKLEADEAVRRNEYHQALQILRSLNNPIANKRFQDYVKKLENIDAILTPAHS